MPNKRVGIEYPTRSGILISPKANPSGSKAYRVDIPATITGTKRVQRQFPSIVEAKIYADDCHKEITKLGHEAFTLTSAQRHDAARALRLLAPAALSLEDAAMIAMRHLPQNSQRITVEALRAAFLAAPGKKKNKLTSRRPHTMRGLQWRTKRFARSFGERLASDVTPVQVKSWLAGLGALAPASLNNFRRALHAMFSFAVSEGYCATNPVSRIPLYAVPDTAPAILTIDECRRLLEAAMASSDTLGLLPYVTFALFTGLRRAELERLTWSAYKEDRHFITVDGHAAKTGSIRNVPLPDNAAAWIARCKTTNGPIAPRNLNFRLRRLRAIAGLSTWSGNELRHSFASYHYDLHQNAPLTAAMLGHASGTQILFAHYRSLVTLGDGERYFSIFPPDTLSSRVTSLVAM